MIRREALEAQWNGLPACDILCLVAASCQSTGCGQGYNQKGTFHFTIQCVWFDLN